MANSRKKSLLGWALSTTAALAAGLGMAGAASAQPAPAKPAAAAEEDIVITAERRSESLQKVSISATVLNAAALDKMGVDTIADVQQVAPSLAINTYNRSTFINIRGVGIAQSAPTSNPGVATYVDGVLLPHEQMIGQSFYDLNAIEVLRGPQGTLTGQNSTGGAVYITTPAPRFGEWSGSLEQTIGDYSAYRTIGAINAPLGDKAAVRVAAVYDLRDSFTTNIGGSGAQPGNVDLFAYRVSAAFQPITALRLNLRYSRYMNDTDYNAIKLRSDISHDAFTIEENGPSDFYQKGYVASAEALYDFSAPIRFRWISSYQDGFTQDISDGDRTTAVNNRLSYGKTIFRTQTHEANLLSTGDGAIDWLAGAFYLDEKIPVTLLRWNAQMSLPAALLVTPNSKIVTEADNTSKSIFGQVGWKFTPRWKLIAGVRYSQDQQIYQKLATPPTPFTAKPTGTQKSSEPTGRIALNWTPTGDTLYYVSLSKGYKGGGVNLGTTDPNFKPERNFVGELGMKRAFFDRQLRINTDVFYSQYKDIQLATLIAGLPVTQNAPEVKSYGLELEALGAAGDFHYNLGLSYLHARFGEPALLQDAIIAANVTAPEGSRFVFSPEWTGTGGAEYDFHFGSTTLTPRLQVSYIDEQLATPFPHVETIVPSHTVWDAKMTFKPNDTLQVEGFITNLANTTYIAAQVQDSSSATGGIIYGAPRQIGMRLKAKF